MTLLYVKIRPMHYYVTTTLFTVTLLHVSALKGPFSGLGNA